MREGPFESIWIQPAAGDAGAALGVALFIWHQLLEKPRAAAAGDRLHRSLLGPRFSDDQVIAAVEKLGLSYRRFEDDETLCDYVADLIANENVVGWMQGRMEFGPRALGCRSILGDARNPKMQSVMNLKIKFRESFRPFAPAVLASEASDWFELDRESPYMMLVAPVRAERRTAGGDASLVGLDLLKGIRSQIPAVTHVDYSARVQTVDEEHGRFHRLLERFRDKTGCPVVINTSFNVRGEPIVCRPEEAARCFMATDMDALVMERVVLLKHEQKQTGDRAAYLKQFELD